MPVLARSSNRIYGQVALFCTGNGNKQRKVTNFTTIKSLMICKKGSVKSK